MVEFFSKRKGQKGFTLIELLVVIAIIGILAAIVLVSLAGARSRAYDAEIEAELSQLRAEAEMEYIDEGAYEGITIPTALTPPACSADNVTGYLKAFGDRTVAGINCQSYVVWADLCAADDDWCVDSSGNSKNVAVTATADATTVAAVSCP